MVFSILKEALIFFFFILGLIVFWMCYSLNYIQKLKNLIDSQITSMLASFIPLT